MRTLAIVLALIIGLAAPGAAAPPEHTGGPGGNDNPPGQNNGSQAPPGQTKTDKPAGPPGQVKKQPGAGTPAPPDQDAAQDAVEQQQALPLARIVKIAERRTSARVINARMLNVSGHLLYQLTMLDAGGKSWRDYYLADSGRAVVLR